MPKKGHNEEQILAALHEGESGTEVAEICRRLGISQAQHTCVGKEGCRAGHQRIAGTALLREENGKYVNAR